MPDETDQLDLPPGLCPLTASTALERAFTIAPRLEAVVASDGRYSFGELRDEVTRIRGSLVAAGLRKGDVVAICMGNSRRWLALFLALASAGMVVVPVNTRFRGEELARVLLRSRAKALFIADRFLTVDFIAMLRTICRACDTKLPDDALPDLVTIVVIGATIPAGCTSWAAFLGRSIAAPSDCRPDDLMLIQYTSGTTSFPKGVMLTHGQMLMNAFFSGERMGLRAGDRFHSARPFFHVAGTTLSILASLQHAVTLITMDRFEPGEALELLEAEQCTHVSGNDTMALMMLAHPDRSRRRLSLRGGWFAASPTIMQRVIHELGARECVAGYGLSEASPNVAQSAWWEAEQVRAGSWMLPQPGVAVEIRGADGHSLPPDESGEIMVRGWNVMRGYLDDPDATALAVDVDGWLATGDLGRLDRDGRLQFLGRIKEIIRVGGENVSPAEVEDVLHRHPSVRQAAIVGVPDERLIEVVAAFVVARDGSRVAPDELIAWSRERLAGFKVPRHVWIVDGFDALGMTASGKIQKKMLAEHAANLLGGGNRPAS